MMNTATGWRLPLVLCLFYIVIMTPLMGLKKGYTVDATPSFELTRAIVQQGDFFPEISVKQGYSYSIVYLPFYGLGQLTALFFDDTQSEWILRKSMCWMNTVLTGLTLAGMALVLRQLGFGERAQTVVPLIYGFSTMAFAYARYDYNKCLAGLLIVSGFYFFLRLMQEKTNWPALGCGLCMMLLIALRLELGLIAAIFAALYLVLSGFEKPTIKRCVYFILPVLTGAGFVGIYNYLYWQGQAAGGYSGSFTINFIPGLTGFLFSPGKSVFIFNPVLLMALLCFTRFHKHTGKIFWVWLSSWAAVLLLYSCWQFWWGGWCWGPRHLLPILPILCLPLAVAVDSDRVQEKTVLFLLTAAGLFMQWLGTFVDFNDVLLLLQNNGVEEQSIIWNPLYSQWFHHYLLVKQLPLARWDYGWVGLFQHSPLFINLILLLIWFAVSSLLGYEMYRLSREKAH